MDRQSAQPAVPSPPLEIGPQVNPLALYDITVSYAYNNLHSQYFDAPHLL